MPTLKRFGNCAVVIRSREHQPPHFHIIFRDQRECVVLLPSLELFSGDPVRATEVAMVMKWAASKKEWLMSKWKEITKK